MYPWNRRKQSLLYSLQGLFASCLPSTWFQRPSLRRIGESSERFLSRRFERYPLVPRRHAFFILHGIAETFGLDTQLAQNVEGHQSAMRVECHDMGEDPAEGEGLRRFA